MKLTIEVNNEHEAAQLLSIVKSLPFESVTLVVEPTDNTPTTRDVLPEIQRPIVAKLDLDAIKAAKQYKGVNRKRFDELVDKINLNEPIEVLQAQLCQ